MYRPLGSSDKLRWTWVKEELEEVLQNVQGRTSSPFDLYLFNEDVDVFVNQSARQVSNTLAQAVTTGNTNLPAALRLATADSSKPILIILVTDGLAVSSRENATILAENLSRTAVLRRSRIVSLQAGYSAEGASFVASLNDALKRAVWVNRLTQYSLKKLRRREFSVLSNRFLCSKPVYSRNKFRLKV